MTFKWVLLTAVLGVVAGLDCSGCSPGNQKPDSGVDAGPGTGFLSVGIAAPMGTSPTVTVQGPNGYSHPLTSSAVLTVPPGSYSVTTPNVTSGASAAPVVYTARVTGSPAAVVASAASQINVDYTAVNGTGHVWISGYDVFSGNNTPALLGFNPLANDPSVIVDDGVDSAPCLEGLAVDSQGSIWAADDCLGRVIKFSADQLTTGVAQPAVIIGNSPDGGKGLKSDGGYSLLRPVAVAFDSQGNLWVADYGNGAILKYNSPGAFAGVVVTEPSAVLDGGGIAYSNPYGLAFDSSGNLWVSSFSPGQVSMYTNPSGLAGASSPSPNVVLTSVTDGGLLAFDHPQGLAFDSAGNLWVANLGNSTTSTVAKVASSVLSASAAVQPAGLFVNASPNVPFKNAEYLAFDQDGNLWIGDNNQAEELRAADVAALSGAQPADAGWIFFYSNGYGGVAIDPNPTNLPLPH